ncbi:MAG: photosystem II S4 domain protein [Cyanobacteriota bacterium]|nr:photosystem II S4 domain protein [Cyanobacteriota bacterium]
MLPRQELLEGSPDPEALAPLIDLAEQVLRTWQPCWSPFLPAALREEAERRLGNLSELSLHGEGGYGGAERRRLRLQRSEADLDPMDGPEALHGLEISGNFLFDPADPEDVRQALLAAGARAGDVGDIWMRGDRGAQAIVTVELAQRLRGLSGRIRSVCVEFRARPLAELQVPAQRASKRQTSVEASLRLDALASAGFGVSRNRMSQLIRGGAVRLNWQPMFTPGRELSLGDRIQLQGRGELLVEQLSLTRRDRWRVTLLRR